MSFAALLVGTLLTTAASSDAEVLRAAEESFLAGVRAAGTPEETPAFRHAADAYAELHRRGHRSAALYRNEGNACLLGGDVAGAILAYRRGLRLAPGDADLQAGLAQARSQVLYPPSGTFACPPAEHWPPALPHLRPAAMLGIATFLYATACGFFARFYLLRRRRALAFGLVLFAAACVPGVGVFLDIAEQRRSVEQPLVVIADDNVILRKGDGHTFPKRSALPLNRGIEARLLFDRGIWIQIELASGEAGWVPREDTLIDE